MIIEINNNIDIKILSFKMRLDPEYFNYVETKQDDEIFRNEEKYLYCNTCKNIITPASSKIEISGNHIHTFKNPAGVFFEIGCFQTAPGCIINGEPTAEFTWFPGFLWDFVLCSQCTIHIGWRYTSYSDTFFGLILNNLIQDI